eukprot:6626270-Alexandrium_andersonii.AAC.1
MDRNKIVLDLLPRDAMPQSNKHGEKNYTVARPSEAKIQVQIAVRSFYVSHAAPGVELAVSRTFRWVHFENIQAAWKAA